MNRLMLMAMGGYMGGSGDMGMMGGGAAGAGLIDSLKTKLSFLPEWAAILVIAILVILVAMLVGWIGGKIIGSILYPDPDKQSILSKKQKFMVLGGAIAAICLTIFALTYTPAPDTGDGTLPVGGEVTDGEISDGEPQDGEVTDGEPTDGETTDDTAEEESTAASDSGSTAQSGGSAAVGGGGVMISGGGTAIAVPMG